jgi:membrane protein YdbS with pleckstrin-like domain
VSELTIRPTAKFIMVRAIVSVAIFIVVEMAWYTQWRGDARFQFVPIVAPLVLISPALKALRRQFTKTTVAGDRLRYETGLFAKSTRTLQLSKLQDVRVDQSVTQRMFGIGSLSLETSGETSRLTLDDVDNPQAVADELLNRAQHGTPA